MKMVLQPHTDNYLEYMKEMLVNEYNLTEEKRLRQAPYFLAQGSRIAPPEPSVIESRRWLQGTRSRGYMVLQGFLENLWNKHSRHYVALHSRGCWASSRVDGQAFYDTIWSAWEVLNGGYIRNAL